MADEKLIEQFNSARASFLAQDFIGPRMAALEGLCRKFPLLMENAEAEDTKKALASGCADLIVTIGGPYQGAHINAINAGTHSVVTLGETFLKAVDPAYIPEKLESRLSAQALNLFDWAEQQAFIDPAQAIRNEADALSGLAKKVKAIRAASAAHLEQRP
jgi:hypothetical protein